MTGQIALTLAILGSLIALFVGAWLRIDVVALLLLLVLLATGLITPTEAFSGFSNPAVITVGAVFVLSAGLLRTGVAAQLGRVLLGWAGTRRSRLVALIMATAGLLSSVMNNVGATAVLLPSTVSMARQSRINASRLLMPLAFGSFLGGMLTLIGTPSNILVSDALRQAGLTPFALFDFAPVGALALVLGIGYMAWFGWRLLPDRSPEEWLAMAAGPEVDLADLYRLGERMFRARVPSGSPLVGHRLAESGLRQRFELSVIGLERHGETRLAPGRDTTLRHGDVLLLEGRVDSVGEAETAGLIEVQPDMKPGDREIQSEAVGIAEAILSPHSRLVGQTLSDIQFREKLHLTVLAILRAGQPRRTGLATLPLRFGDTLLVQGPRQNIRMLQREPDFVVLGDVEADPRVRARKAPVAVALLLVMLVPALAGWLPIAASALLAGLLMVASGCITMDEAYQSIDWRSVFLVAGTLPLGIAMQKTGTADYLAEGMARALGALGPLALLAGFFVLTNLLTQFMSSPAVAVLVAPIAINVAQHAGANPRALLMGVAIATGSTFLTPVAHQANVLVMGPGGYRFTDYVKAGLPLSLITLVATLVVVPLLWP